MSGKENGDVMRIVTTIIFIISIIGSFCFDYSPYGFYMGSSISNVKYCGTIALIMTAITTLIYQVCGIMVSRKSEGWISTILGCSFALYIGYCALSCEGIKYINAKYDESNSIVTKYEVLEKHRYVNTGRKRNQVSYAVKLKNPSNGETFEYKLSGQRALDEFEEGGTCEIKSKRGYLGFPFFISHKTFPKPQTPPNSKNNETKKNLKLPKFGN